MRISWVLSDSAVIDPTLDIDRLKDIGPIWGGWRTWRSYATDNVVCHVESEARDLISKNFHTRCNMYLPEALYQLLDRPNKINLYRGEFCDIIDQSDEIVSMHLAAASSDIVLLVGVDISLKDLEYNKLDKHNRYNYMQYFLHVVKGTPTVQWVLLDHTGDIEPALKKVSNLQFDTLENVLLQFK